MSTKQSIYEKMENLQKDIKESNLKTRREISKEKERVTILIFLSMLSIICVLIVIGTTIHKFINQKEILNMSNQRVNRQVTIIENKNEDELINNVTLPIWGIASYKTLNENEKKDILSSDTNFTNTFFSYQSEEDGFTSNTNKKFDSYGYPNLKYVNATREDMQLQLALIVNRIINPIFGNWKDYQIKKDRTILLNNFYDIASLDNEEEFVKIFNFEKSDSKNIYFGQIKDLSISDKDNGNLQVDMKISYLITDGDILENRNIQLEIKNQNDKLVIVGGVVNEK